MSPAPSQSDARRRAHDPRGEQRQNNVAHVQLFYFTATSGDY